MRAKDIGVSEHSRQFLPVLGNGDQRYSPTKVEDATHGIGHEGEMAIMRRLDELVERHSELEACQVHS